MRRIYERSARLIATTVVAYGVAIGSSVAAPGDMPVFDQSFGSNGVGPSPVMATLVRAIAKVPSGGYFVAGTSGSCGSVVGCIELVRYSENGDLQGFRRIPTTVGFGAPIAAFVTDAGSNVLVVGFTNARLTLIKVALLSGLPLVDSFGSSGIQHYTFGTSGADTFPAASVISPDRQHIYVSGSSDAIYNEDSDAPFLAKIAVSSGSLAQEFGADGWIALPSGARTLEFDVQRNKLLAGGRSGQQAALTRFDPISGAVDASFGLNGSVTFQLGSLAVGSSQRFDRVEHSAIASNSNKLYVVTNTRFPIDNAPIGLSSYAQRLALFDLDLNAFQPNFGESGFLDVDLDSKVLRHSPSTNRLYVGSSSSGITGYLADSGAKDIEFGLSGTLAWSELSARYSGSMPFFEASGLFEIERSRMTLGNSRLMRLSLARCDLDLDANDAVTTTKDGIALLRMLRGASVEGIWPDPNTGVRRASDSSVSNYARLIVGSGFPDADGNGTVAAEVDGLLLLRHLLGFRGDSLIDGVAFANGALRQTPDDIASYFSTSCGLQ